MFDQENFWLMCDQCKKKKVINTKKKLTLKNKKNGCLYSRQIKTVQQIMTLKEIATQNQEPEPKKNRKRPI